MWRNYLNTAFRQLRKSPFYSSINIFGLALGLACFLFILLYVKDELSFDRFHTGLDRIYRIHFKGELFDQEINIPQVGDPWGPLLKENYPEIEEMTRLREIGSQRVSYEDRSYREDNLVHADSTFFEVFSFELLEGDPRRALTDPNTIVVSSDLARKYFGEAEALGKSLRFGEDDLYRITGIMAPMPRNSHMRYDILISMAGRDESRSQQWLSFNFYTYLLLREGADPKRLETAFEDIARTYIGSDLEQYMGQSYDDFLAGGNTLEFSMFPLSRIHLESHTTDEIEAPGDIRYVYIFSFIGLFILLLACINFMNLATSRSAGRAREVGMRKVVGARRSQLIQQFLSESLLIVFIALVLAALLLVLGLPWFNRLADKDIALAALFQPWLIFSMLGLTLLVGLLAGSYPAFFLSGFRPIRVLKGRLVRNAGSEWLRNGLVVFQFAITIGLIVGTLVMYDQMRFMQKKKLGYEKDHLLVLNGAFSLGDKLEPFRQGLLQDPRIQNLTVTSFLPTPSSRNNNAHFLGNNPEPEHTQVLQSWSVDYDFLETLGIEIAEGRNFSRERPADSSAVLLNEEAVRIYGLEQPIGQEIGTFSSGNASEAEIETYRVIGVIRDFHFESLRQPIGPMVLYPGSWGQYIVMRVRGDDLSGLIAELRQKWNAMETGEPFDHNFLDDRFEAMYTGERQVGQILTLFTVLAIVIACLGLFGLATYIAERRTKEIGIRKVLGAPIGSIFMLLTSQFTRWVLLANLFAMPLAWYAMRRWLEGFAYQAGINPWMLVLAAVAALAIALLTVSFQALRVARINPVRSLRYE